MLRFVPRPLVAAGVGLVIAGVVLLAAGAEAGALAAGGLGAILLAGAVFYAIGRSEDADRERGGRADPAAPRTRRRPPQDTSGN